MKNRPNRSRRDQAVRRTAFAALIGAAAIKAVRTLDDRAVINDPRGSELVPLPPTARTVVTSADGTAINVRIYGPDGAPTVVLAHGWTCAIDFWTPQIRGLCADRRVVAYDQRGHGRSGLPGPSGCTMDALADDLLAVLDACVPAGERAVVAGHSMGGFATLALAGRHPAELRRRVAGVVLASTAAVDVLADARVLPGGPAALRT
ncbi:MAG: alpha/beta fold hydrolase, partial [Frankia sp.]